MAIALQLTAHPCSRLEDPYSKFDNRSFLKKIYHLVISLFREIFHIIYMSFLRIISPSSYSYKSQNSKGLFVLVHGLLDHACSWKSQIKLLKKHSNIDIFVPRVHLLGNCSLEQAAKPILPHILEYTKSHPKKPICLLGFSNGSRIVTWLETKLRKKTSSSAVKVSTIAGVHFGSSVITRMNKIGLSKWMFSPAIRKELAYASRKSQLLIQKVLEPLSPQVAKRDYEFYATTEDILVPNTDSSLPILGKGEKFHLIHGYGHTTIVEAVAKQQIASCIKWITLNAS